MTTWFWRCQAHCRNGQERPGVSIGLFAATVLSVFWVGSAYEGKTNILEGWPFAVSLLGILLAHEMGHYVVARHYGLPASLPYFIPLPLSLIGTMGAVIQMKAPAAKPPDTAAARGSWPSRRHGRGCACADHWVDDVPVAVIPPMAGFFQEGNSILYAGLKILIFGQFLPSGNVDVLINSVALAGWAGLLVTALNLIPAGQLDGGHIAYALLGRRARWLSWGVFGALLALSLYWQVWLLWAGLVLLLGRAHSVPLDDITPLGPDREANRGAGDSRLCAGVHAGANGVSLGSAWSRTRRAGRRR